MGEFVLFPVCFKPRGENIGMLLVIGLNRISEILDPRERKRFLLHFLHRASGYFLQQFRGFLKERDIEAGLWEYILPIGQWGA